MTPVLSADCGVVNVSMTCVFSADCGVVNFFYYACVVCRL
jgi:hypothetical protein